MSFFQHRGVRWLILCVVVGLVGIGLYSLFSKPSTPASVSAQALHRTWLERTQEILTQYDAKPDAAVARDALLALTVAGDDRQMHLDLVLAFESLTKKDPQAPARLQKVRRAFEALRGTARPTTP